MRLREPLSDPSSGLRVVDASYTGHIPHLIMSLQFGVQSHHLFSVWHSKSLFISSSAFRVTISFQFGVQSPSPVWHSESLLLLSYGRSEPLSLLSLGVQSHVSITAFKAFIFFSLAFRATSPISPSESPSLLSLGVQSQNLFSFWSSDLLSPTWRSEPLSLLNFGF